MLKQLIAAAGLMCALPHAFSDSTHFIVAPSCLIKSFTHVEKLAKNRTFSLVKLNDAELDRLIEIKNTKNNHCGGFMDVTAFVGKQSPDALLTSYTAPKKPITPPKNSFEIKYESTVNPLLSKVSPDSMKTNLTSLSSFKDRYSKGQRGVTAAFWLKEQMEVLVAENNRSDVTMRFVKTGGEYVQPSLVVKVGTSDEPGIVIGGHMDTLSSAFEVKPGADDDGSGTVTTLDVARVILSSGLHFKRPIYFVWYAAEEMGLIGSQVVVKDFKKNHIPVLAALQFDMTGYSNPSDPLSIWLMDDYTDKTLTRYLETLIHTYVKDPDTNIPRTVKHSACGYACSDHASWYLGDVASAIPFETEMDHDNPDIHTSNDIVDNLNFVHMTDYAKTGVAFAVELAEPVV